MTERRITPTEYFLSMAELVARRSTCIRAQHGAVIVKAGQVISTGYNGASCGHAHCSETQVCARDEAGVAPGTRYELCVSVHAEANAIVQAAKHGISVEGATIYITDVPCLMCSRLIVNSGITNVVCWDSGRYAPAVQVFSSAGVKTIELVKLNK